MFNGAAMRFEFMSIHQTSLRELENNQILKNSRNNWYQNALTNF